MNLRLTLFILYFTDRVNPRNFWLNIITINQVMNNLSVKFMSSKFPERNNSMPSKTWIFVINKFSNIDLLIECHDFYNVGLTQHLKNLFMDSHAAQQVFSIDDLYRPMAFTSRNFLPEYLTYVEKYKLLKEYRKAQMSWIVLSSK